jgi:hypothetical protein
LIALAHLSENTHAHKENNSIVSIYMKIKTEKKNQTSSVNSSKVCRCRACKCENMPPPTGLTTFDDDDDDDDDDGGVTCKGGERTNFLWPANY